jgi:hypothetical protein
MSNYDRKHAIDPLNELLRKFGGSVEWRVSRLSDHSRWECRCGDAGNRATYDGAMGELKEHRRTVHGL